ncbi:MAG: hypothetical protein U0166_10325 [Acidobacteriota bacterium]
MRHESPAPDPVLEESLEALAMPPRILRLWLEDRRAFCMKHGGDRYYADVLELVEQCLAIAKRC